MQRPADVVVVGPLLAVGEPAVRAQEAVVQREVLGHVGGGPWSCDRAQERLHHQAEPEPVGARVGAVPDGGRQVVDHVLLHPRSQPVPDPGPGHVEDQRDRGGLDLGLPVLAETNPAVGRRWVGALGDPFGVPLGQVGRVLAALPREAEAGEQERPGEAFQAVDRAAVAALGPRQRDAGVPGRGMGADRGEHRVGQAGPLLAGPTGDLGGRGQARTAAGQGLTVLRHLARPSPSKRPRTMPGRVHEVDLL